MNKSIHWLVASAVVAAFCALTIGLWWAGQPGIGAWIDLAVVGCSAVLLPILWYKRYGRNWLIRIRPASWACATPRASRITRRCAWMGIGLSLSIVLVWILSLVDGRGYCLSSGRFAGFRNGCFFLFDAGSFYAPGQIIEISGGVTLKWIHFEGWRGPGSELTVPLWIPLLVVFIPAILAWLRILPWPEGFCQRCGYDLTGNVTGTCPECGQAA